MKVAYTDSERKYFYPKIIEKINTVFMSLFTNIRVGKYDENNSLINYRNVPIVFGSKQKFLATLTKDASQEFMYSQYLPKMATIMKGLTPLPSKVQGSEILSYLNAVSSTEFEDIFRPTPYKIDFTLSIISLHLTEMTQILEQILPFFTPFRVVTIKEIDAIPSFTRDIKINLTGTTPDFMDTVDEQSIRKFIWDLEFSADCFLYKPILYANLIKTVKVEMLDLNTNNLTETYTYEVSGTPESPTVVKDEWK